MTTALAQIRAYVKAELKAGRQVSWAAAFAASEQLTLEHIREWFDDLPPNLRKAEAIEWLARKACDEVGLKVDQ